MAEPRQDLPSTVDVRYRRRIEAKLRERGVPEDEVADRASELLARDLPIDFRAAGLLG